MVVVVYDTFPSLSKLGQQMRPLAREPESPEFMSWEDYEKSIPASFGLPELPVLKYKANVTPSTSVWVSSDGIYVWESEKESGFLYDLETVTVVRDALILPNRQPIGIQQPVIAADLRMALVACLKSFGNSTTPDSVEIALPVDYETGDADDLGYEQLIQSVGEGLSTKDGPIIAQKRKRSN